MLSETEPSMTTERAGHRVSDLRVLAREGGSVLVEHVDLALAPREIVGIVGETGAGKTLTTRALLGLLPSSLAATGTLQMGDADPVELADLRALRRQLGRTVGCVLQNPMTMLDPIQRIKRQLVEGVTRSRLLEKRAASERAVALLERMGFRDPEAVGKLYPHQLSGGMAQRVAIAMCLMSSPDLIVLDEPTSALDAHTRISVLELLRDAAGEQGAAVILVGHDLGLVQRFCDRLVVMYAGTVVEDGPAREIARSPQHPYTQALLACSATLSAPNRERLRSIPGTVPSPAERPHGCPFHTRCAHVFERCVEERPRLGGEPGSRAACHLAPNVSDVAIAPDAPTAPHAPNSPGIARGPKERDADATG
ncbi:MAG TPA: ABC transporter ATP-binding protein [Conexibacter sp.]|jgi:oligopeptide/dipeptide ABC transporter ATP-binding protein|nr:ABC transporter ATP-binding protein [Conexibacter sp.]